MQKRLQDYLCENFYITTSRNFNDQALICAILTMGADRILFSVDYPYEMMGPAARWTEARRSAKTIVARLLIATRRPYFISKVERKQFA